MYISKLIDETSVSLPDGLYSVTTPYFVAGFVVKGGVVRECAPILRKKLKYWVTKGVLIEKE